MTATLTTLFGFNAADAGNARASLIVDSNGDLFGTDDDPNGEGRVFEIAKTVTGYASTATTLVSFSGFPNDAVADGLIADTSGDLFGTTIDTLGSLSVFEIVKTESGYASTPAMLASFDGVGVNQESPAGNLIADANGDLFWTTEFGGPGNEGTVFEIAKTPTGYASTPTRLVSFNGPTGAFPVGSLISDASGDLFGATNAGGPGPTDAGTVFEVVKTPTGYATTPTTLVGFFSFDVGAFPEGGLIADANGDLFGTTSDGGAIFGDGGVVFEIKKTAGGYASTPTTLVNFNGADGEQPMAGLLIDANGDLFGTTYIGGSDNLGTVFEIKKTSAGYASTPTVLANFNGTNGDHPMGGLTADANGDLFGTTLEGGPFQSEFDGGGTVFEITGSGFVPVTAPPPPLTGTHDILWQSTSTGQVSLWDLSGATRTGGGPVANLGPSWQAVATGDFDGDGKSDILWQNANGQVSIWEMDGNTHTGGGAVANLGPSWRAIDTGDFDGDGKSDILWQNANGQVSIWEMDGNTHTGGGAVANLGPSWKVAGTGDFNGDGKSDILWQNTDGQVSIWEMDGNTRTGGGSVANLGPDWHAVGTGDYNGDGKSDILWQNTSTGQVSIWEMDGNIHNGGGPVRNLAPSWHAVGTNGGGSDILWQNTSGQTSIWQMNGNTIAGAGAISPNLGPSWHAVGLT